MGFRARSCDVQVYIYILYVSEADKSLYVVKAARAMASAYMHTREERKKK